MAAIKLTTPSTVTAGTLPPIKSDTIGTGMVLGAGDQGQGMTGSVGATPPKVVPPSLVGQIPKTVGEIKTTTSITGMPPTGMKMPTPPITPPTTPPTGATAPIAPQVPTVPITPDTAEPTTPATPATPVTQKDGSTKTYVNEATGKPWNIDDYKVDYSAEFNRIMKLNPADPRLDMLDQARADKVLADPTKYPDLVQWAKDIKSGQWRAEDYANDYQSEINRLRATNPADPRIDKLEHLRAAKILSGGAYDQATKDWAVDVDRRNWNIDNYKQDYSAEINRISKFNPNDPRIALLEQARAAKILANPTAYTSTQVQNAKDYQERHADEIAQQQLTRQYQKSEVQADLATQRAIQTIKDYYASKGLGTGGQAAAGVQQAAMQGLTGYQTLEEQRQAAQSNLTGQQIAAREQKAYQKKQQELLEKQLELQRKQLEQQRKSLGL